MGGKEGETEEKPAELDMLTTLAPGLRIKRVQREKFNGIHLKPQDGEEDVANSFVGPVVGRQGHLRCIYCNWSSEYTCEENIILFLDKTSA